MVCNGTADGTITVDGTMTVTGFSTTILELQINKYIIEYPW